MTQVIGATIPNNLVFTAANCPPAQSLPNTIVIVDGAAMIVDSTVPGVYPAGFTTLGGSGVSPIEAYNFSEALYYVSAQTFDPCWADGSAFPALGAIAAVKVVPRVNFNLFAITFRVSATGSLTANSYLGVYDSSGNLLAVTGDITTQFMTNGIQTATFLSSPTLIAGQEYWVAMLMNGTVASILRGCSGTDSNLFCAQGKLRQISFGSGLTSMPASITTTTARDATLPYFSLS
jgi:hypothetical protein